MNDEVITDAGLVAVVVRLLLVLALCAANSALLYFVIWEMVTPGNPYGVILFIISGSAHLLYFFLPWFIKEQLGPLFQTAAPDSLRRGSGADDQQGGEIQNFARMAVQVGVALCLATVALWSLQSEISGEGAHSMALITEANCVQIGGEPKEVAGRLLCILKDKADQVERSDTREKKL